VLPEQKAYCELQPTTLQPASFGKIPMLMANQDESCPDCGGKHSQSVSNRMLKLFQQYKETDDPFDKAGIANEIAEVALHEHDFTDFALNEGYHKYYEDFQQARNKYDEASLKLARLALNVIEGYLEVHEMTVEAAIGEAPNKNAN